MTQVQDSSDCCINSKFSSAQKGYFQDEYLALFTKKFCPRSPIINRGYYIRFKAVEHILHSWWCGLDGDNKKFQIISLGAGLDSSYFRLKKNNSLPKHCQYIEIDFPDVLKKKLNCVQKLLPLKIEESSNSNLPSLDSAIIYCSPEYSMLGLDLCDIGSLSKNLNLVGIEPDLPSLFISECSITYMEPSNSRELIIYIQKTFPNSIFVAYEQIYPHDAFGIIMRNHFLQVGCSLKAITLYPDKDSQAKRFKEMGWSKCLCITMYEFYCSLAQEEKERISHLELFDEFEMWHEKCHHYILVQASQGIFSNISHLVPSQSENMPLLSSSRSLCWKFLRSAEVIQRFGHQAVSLSPSLIMLCGGFGVSCKKHRKMDDIVLYNFKFAKCVSAVKTDCFRMYHSATKLSNQSIVLLGGRASPKKPHGKISVISISSPVEETDQSVGFSVKTVQNSMPLPTWRHSASLVTVKGVECIFIFGGLSEDCAAVNRGFLLNTDTWEWSEIPLTENTPSARHSHSCATYNDSLIVSGGLSSTEHILQTVHAFNCMLFSWSTLKVMGLLPRYSHTSHVYGDHLFLVGGVTSVPHLKLGVAVVNLMTLIAYEVHLPGQDLEFPVLLCSHCSCLVGTEIMIVGGGGNCFSFGTHFNTHALSFDIKPFLD